MRTPAAGEPAVGRVVATGRKPMGTGSSTVPDERTHRQTPIELLLPRLDRVQARGRDQWYASCPTPAHAHGDRSRGLSIRELGDGRILLHCFAGCSVGEIVIAVGLELHDLFPPSHEPRRGARPAFDLRDVLVVIRDEALLVAAAAGWLDMGRTLSSAEFDRLVLAEKRIRTALEVAGVR